MDRVRCLSRCALIMLVAACTPTPGERQSSSPASATSVPSRSAPLATTAAQQPTASSSATSAAVDPSTIARISPEQARRKVQAGEALLVCAYGDRSKCGGVKLEGSIVYADFAEKLPELDKDSEIILYCA